MTLIRFFASKSAVFLNLDEVMRCAGVVRNKSNAHKSKAMTTTVKNKITVEATVKAPAEKVWKHWNSPESIKQWNSASDDWHTPRAENDLRPGGTFSSRMEAKDGSFGFDFSGIYDEVRTNELITYTMGDGRKVQVTFTEKGGETKVSETFEAESINPLDMQRGGWQAILDNFKKFVEAQ